MKISGSFVPGIFQFLEVKVSIYLNRRAFLLPFALYYYTPDIQSMWGYIVFAFPFVRPFVRTFVRSFVRLSVTGSKFLR